MKLFLLFAMIFCHIIADYNLQGWLANAKRAKWWEDNCRDWFYANDYKTALFMHSFSWTFVVLLPIVLYFGFNMTYPFAFMFNVILHYYIDDLKANHCKINLTEDQILHMFQIFATWIIYCLVW